MAAVVTLCWFMFFGFSRLAAPACDLLDRTAWAFASGFGTAGFLLPFTYVEPAWLRLLLAVALGAIGTAVGWWLGTLGFPQFC